MWDWTGGAKRKGGGRKAGGLSKAKCMVGFFSWCSNTGRAGRLAGGLLSRTKLLQGYSHKGKGKKAGWGRAIGQEKKTQAETEPASQAG